MTQFVPVCSATEIGPGHGRSVTVGGAVVALFRVGEAVLACSGTCPHRGGPLGEGELEGGVVTCPWHGFQFEVTTGESADGRPFRVRTYPTRIVDGMIEVGLD